MPNFLAHHLFAKDLYLKYDLNLPYDDRAFLKNNFYFLSWGSQGPDPLFFTGLLPQNGLHLLTALKKIGNSLHKDNAVKLFTIMCETYNSIKDTENKESIKAFILGQFGHYLLDSITHPFILYESGFDENGKLKGEYHFLHSQYEMLIDVSLAKIKKVDLYLSKPSEYLQIDKEKLLIIDDFFYKILTKYCLNMKLPKKIYSSGAKNMHSLITYVNNGSKIRTLPFKNTGLGALRIETDNDIDVLNSKHDIWLHPVIGEKNTKSFLDLYNDAQIKLSSLYEAIKDKDILEIKDFNPYISGLDYYGKNKNDILKFCKR